MPSLRRRVGVRRRLKQEAGLTGLIPNILPDKPSFASILRQLLAGIFSSQQRTRRVVRKEYEFTVKGRKKMRRDMLRAYYQAAHVTTAQAALIALGEVIYSTPIITSRLAQNWSLKVSRAISAFKAVVIKKNHEQVFMDAQQEFQPELEKIKQHAKKTADRSRGDVDIDLHLTNPTPYITKARTPAYWSATIARAWAYQQRNLQKVFDKNAKRLGL